MKKLVSVLFLAVAFASTARADEAAKAGADGIVFQHDVFYFGEVDEGEQVSHDYVGKNMSGQSIKIVDTKASCGCTVAHVSTKRVAPGEEIVVNIAFDTSERKGKTRKRVRIETDKEDQPYVDIFIEGVIHAQTEDAKAEPCESDCGE